MLLILTFLRYQLQTKSQLQAMDMKHLSRQIYLKINYAPTGNQRLKFKIIVVYQFHYNSMFGDA